MLDSFALLARQPIAHTGVERADGGTHVANTREIGHIRLVGHQSKGRINKHIYIELAV